MIGTDSMYNALIGIEETKYLSDVEYIISHGNKRGDRTGVGTHSMFGITSRYCLLEDKFPLLTTKKMYMKGIVEELLWMISGSTDAKVLSDKGVKIWDANATREALDKRGLQSRREGDLGPVYGFQWRHWGAKYVDCDTDYTGQGIDQLKKCIDTINNDPMSRRIIVSAWNPEDVDSMALPPCHMFYQFYVEGNKLSCLMYQRSADMGLGVPFNIASYALLTRIVAQCTGLVAKELVHCIGDAHVYKNHVDALRTQMQRHPKGFPTLKINSKNTDIDSFTADMFVVENYDPHPAIKMDMAV